MQLVNFRVQNYRSVNDSGSIDVNKQTALVGRNESGKTNLLLALQSLNPPDREIKEIDKVKNFPNDRLLSECTKNTPVVATTWQLSDEEKQELTSIFARAKKVNLLEINRPYGARRNITFVGLPDLAVDQELVEGVVSKIKKSLESTRKGKSQETIITIDQLLDELQDTCYGFGVEPSEWATGVRSLLKQTTSKLQNINEFSFSDTLTKNTNELASYASNIAIDSDNYAKAEAWVIDRLPIFIYLDDYPVLDGHQNINRYLNIVPHNQTPKNEIEKEAEKNFGKLLKIAGLDATQLKTLLDQNHEQRQQLVNRAGAVVTKKLRQLWKDRKLKVRFDVDGEHFKTLISDDEAEYDIEINLNDRSKGFKWFFSFYITFTADTQGGDAKNAILLLDEPGLFLHATGQKDLLDHFDKDFENQIIYTTHSPFMVPVHSIGSVRTVNADVETGTTVTNDPSGDERTLFPLKSALGYEIAQSLFIQERNLAVEGVTDYWYINAISSYLAELGKSHLPDNLAIIPAGSAQRIPYMISLLSGQKLKVVVLFDSEPQTYQEAQRIKESKLIRDEYIIFCNDVFPDPKPREVDIEDLLDPKVFEKLVSASYEDELKGKTLNINSKIPRIAKRYEIAFSQLGLSFYKTRPARLFIQTMSENPSEVVTPDTIERFDVLFDLINTKIEKLITSDRGQFK